tara:strand:- start:6314 stop:7048 length:735 start_codon:yes stop_codon:yes gene_type:complete
MIQDIEPGILITVAATAFLQSIFGVGVLLFGTPLLLLQGFDFLHAIYVLLPVSMLINLFQIVRDYRRLDVSFFRRIVLYAIPFIVLFLLLVRSVSFDLDLGVGLLLMLVAAKDWTRKAERVVDVILRFEKPYFVVMGSVHGLTNLGGPLLTAAVLNKGYEKRVTRATVAAAYATFAAFQVGTLVASGYNADTTLLGLGVYAATGIVVFLVTETVLYAQIDSDVYSKLFAGFMFVVGVLLCVRAF